MSRLYLSATPDGRNTVTRRGQRRIAAHIRGWDAGVWVDAEADKDGDHFSVYRTGGSNQPSLRQKVAELGGEGKETEFAAELASRDVKYQVESSTGAAVVLGLAAVSLVAFLAYIKLNPPQPKPVIPPSQYTNWPPTPWPTTQWPSPATPGVMSTGVTIPAFAQQTPGARREPAGILG